MCLQRKHTPALPYNDANETCQGTMLSQFVTYTENSKHGKVVMRTPAGKECRHYYEDFHRGRNVQECRLVRDNPESMPWRPVDCSRCPVPEILNANASPHLELKLTIRPRLLGLGRQPEVTAFCARHRIPIEDAFIGCPECNQDRSKGLDVFRKALESADDD
jgi:hypothetical protein